MVFVGPRSCLEFLRPGNVLKSQGGASIQTYARYVLYVIMSNPGPNSNEVINSIGSTRHKYLVSSMLNDCSMYEDVAVLEH